MATVLLNPWRTSLYSFAQMWILWSNTPSDISSPSSQCHVVSPSLWCQQFIEPWVMWEATWNPCSFYCLHHPKEGLPVGRWTLKYGCMEQPLQEADSKLCIQKCSFIFIRGKKSDNTGTCTNSGVSHSISASWIHFRLPESQCNTHWLAFWSTKAAPPSPPVSPVGTQCSSKPVGYKWYMAHTFRARRKGWWRLKIRWMLSANFSISLLSSM